MTNDTSAIEQKVIAAFKGFISSCRLEPMRFESDSLEPKYRRSWRSFSSENDEYLELYYHVELHSRILHLVEKLCPNQVDNKFVSRMLLDTTTDWITGGKDPSDQDHLEQTGHNFISKVRAAIRPLLLFLPIEGLEMVSRESITVGNCELFGNHKGSQLMQVMEQDRKRYPRETEENDALEKIKSYFTTEIIAHSGRAIERVSEEANLALSILRLYISSYYFHEYESSVVRRMGLAGSPQLNERSIVSYINPAQPAEDQYPGVHEGRKVQKNLAIDNQFAEYMKQNGLDRINSLLQSLGVNREGNHVARRLLTAITWFAKATSAKSSADSFLMYAIAIEGLLSEGRTSQETYATQMAALVTGSSEGAVISPGGYLSSSFAKQLKQVPNLNDRFNIVRARILELFSYRNQIAHGAVLDDEVDAGNLLDFETMVQNSILSFVKGEWDSFGQFKIWVRKSVRYDFQPT